jgi:T-complex protein 1 subunit theta
MLSVIISCSLQHFCFLQLENYAKTEEAKVEELIKAVADSGAKVIASGAAVGDMALHFCERYKSVFFMILMDR